MPHQVSTGKHPDIIVLRYYGNIETEDILTDPEELHLNDDHPKYLLADAGEVHPVVPEGMWERVQHSIISHKNLAHIAIFVKSGPLRVLMGAVVKLSRQGKRVTLHNTYEEAETHLLSLVNSAHA
ncbi:MAG: STAS/SEC14 domain-containing protein [Chloroflexota bacterium]